MKTEKIFWTDYSVLVCTKCQKSIPMPPLENSDSPNIAETIKNKYKLELNQAGFNGKVRVLTSSCLGVCPTGFQAVSVVSTSDPAKSLSYVFDPLTESESVLEQIKKMVANT